MEPPYSSGIVLMLIGRRLKDSGMFVKYRTIGKKLDENTAPGKVNSERYPGGSATSRLRPELQLRDKGRQFPVHRNGLLDGHEMSGIRDGHPPTAANVGFKIGAVFRRRQSVI